MRLFFKTEEEHEHLTFNISRRRDAHLKPHHVNCQANYVYWVFLVFFTCIRPQFNTKEYGVQAINLPNTAMIRGLVNNNMFSPGLTLEFSRIELVIQWTICCHIVRQLMQK